MNEFSEWINNSLETMWEIDKQTKKSFLLCYFFTDKKVFNFYFLLSPVLFCSLLCFPFSGMSQNLTCYQVYIYIYINFSFLIQRQQHKKKLMSKYYYEILYFFTDFFRIFFKFLGTINFVCKMKRKIRKCWE